MAAAVPAVHHGRHRPRNSARHDQEQSLGLFDGRNEGIVIFQIYRDRKILDPIFPEMTPRLEFTHRAARDFTKASMDIRLGIPPLCANRRLLRAHRHHQIRIGPAIPGT